MSIFSYSFTPILTWDSCGNSPACGCTTFKGYLFVLYDICTMGCCMISYNFICGLVMRKGLVTYVQLCLTSESCIKWTKCLYLKCKWDFALASYLIECTVSLTMTALMSGSGDLPPPCIWHRYGNRHTFPSPTAYETHAITNCMGLSQLGRASLSMSASCARFQVCAKQPKLWQPVSQ